MYFDTNFRAFRAISVPCGMGLLAFSLANTAAAQAPAESTSMESQLEEIVVTARKQRESIMSVPVAASAVSSTELSRYAITDVSDLGSRVPSINLDRTSTGGGGSLTIRGVGSSTLDTGIEQAVSTVIDGVQTSRGNFIEAGLLDLAQVEVLKGPQALFFGKNSPGGVLSLSSNGPTDEFTSYLRAGYEFDAEEKTLEGAISGPLTDTLRGRVALRRSEMEGWMDNVATSVPNPFAGIPGNSPTIVAPPYKSNESESLIGRVTLEYQPTSNFTATLRLLGNSVEHNGPAADTEVTYCGVPPVVDTLGVFDPSSDCKLDYRQSVGGVPPQLAASHPIYRDGRPYGDFDAYLTSLTLDYSTGPIDITSVTGYMDYGYKRFLVTPTVYGYPFTGEDEQFDQFSQEVRAVTSFDSPVNFTAGVYYEKADLKNVYPNALFPSLADPATGSFLTYVFESGSEGKSYSIFGQVRWKIVENVELAGGARYSRDERSGFALNSYVNPSTFALIPLVPVGTVFSGEKTFSDVSPEATLSWTVVEDTLLYAAYKTGYKAGGTAAPAILPITFTAPTGLFYDPEEIEGFEVGLKTMQLDNKLRLTAAAFTYKYTDLQISNFNSATFLIQALNVGGLRTRGGEVEAVYRPIPALTLNAAVGYTHANYTSFPGIACYAGQTAATGCVGGVEDLTGQQKFRSPEWSGNIGFSYETPVFGNHLLGLSGAMRYSSDYFTQENNSPFAVQDAYSVYDASIRVRSDDNRWQVALIGRNLGDEQYATSSLEAPNAVVSPTIRSSVGRPRQVMLEATLRY